MQIFSLTAILMKTPGRSCFFVALEVEFIGHVVHHDLIYINGAVIKTHQWHSMKYWLVNRDPEKNGLWNNPYLKKKTTHRNFDHCSMVHGCSGERILRPNLDLKIHSFSGPELQVCKNICKHKHISKILLLKKWKGEALINAFTDVYIYI